MEERSDLPLRVLRELQKKGVLRDVILIGSWCHYFYRSYFDNAPEIPVLRTLDLDFLVPNPVRIRNKVDVPEILRGLEFDAVTSYLTGYTRYVHPQLEVEFLTPELGRGRDKPYEIKPLKVNAQGLRFLNLLQQHTIEVTTEGITVRVPEPAAYVLHKFLISGRRAKESKRERDLFSAREIGEFLLQDEGQRKMMQKIFDSLPEKWKRRMKASVKENSQAIHNLLFVGPA